jgi:hypothetical protein
VIVVSNSREAGALGAVKTALSPLMEKVGFATDLDVEGVMVEAGLKMIQTRRVNFHGLHRLFVAENA